MFYQLTMDGVVLQQVDQIVSVHEWIVDGSNLSVASLLREGGSEDETADSTEAVDTHSDVRHCDACLCVV